MSRKELAAAALFGVWMNQQANRRAEGQQSLDLAIAESARNHEEEKILRRGAAAYQAMEDTGEVTPELVAKVREAEALLRQRQQLAFAAERSEMIEQHEARRAALVADKPGALQSGGMFLLAWLILSTVLGFLPAAVTGVAAAALIGWYVRSNAGTVKAKLKEAEAAAAAQLRELDARHANEIAALDGGTA